MRIHRLALLLMALPIFPPVLSARPLAEAYEQLHGSIEARRKLDGALFAAIESRAGWKVSKLLDQGANVNARDWRGLTTLHRAILANNDSAVDVLLSRGANVLAKTPGSYRDCPGCTALHLVAPWASYPPCGRILAALLNFGGNKIVNMKDLRGYTPLMWAFYPKSSEKGVTTLSGVIDVWTIKFLVKAGAAVNAKGPGGVTALHLAAIDRVNDYKNENVNLVRFLLKRGADPTAVWHDGGEALWPSGAADREMRLFAEGKEQEDGLNAIIGVLWADMISRYLPAGRR